MDALDRLWHNHQDLIKIFGGIVVIGGFAFYFVEKRVQKDLSLEDSFWWSLMTTSTAGTSDVEPETWQGKWLITAPITLASIAFLANLFSRITKHHVREVFKEQNAAMGISPQTIRS